MKKQLLVGAAALVMGVSLAGCSLETNSSGVLSSEDAFSRVTTLNKEIVSASLFVSGDSSVSALSSRFNSLTSSSPQSVAPIIINPSDPSETLASFDALSVDSYTISTSTETSDKSEYAREEILSYALPNGTAETMTLYYGTPETETDASSNLDSSASDSSDTAISSASPLEAQNKNGYSFANQNSILHGYGYGSGFATGMLKSQYHFIDFSSSDSDVSLTYTRTSGLAVTSDYERHFVSEEMTAVTSEKTYQLVSFAFFSSSSFVTVEQAYITDGTDMQSVYVYTLFDSGSLTHFLLQNSASSTRLVYRDSLDKVVITRFEKDGNTYYAVHMKGKGSMALVGLYEKVTTTDSEGTTSVNYTKVDPDAGDISIPEED